MVALTERAVSEVKEIIEAQARRQPGCGSQSSAEVAPASATR
jgi:hypothetical protein